MAFFRHSYPLLRTKVCRHCGQQFVTETPAQKTCKRPACVAWSKDVKREQVRKCNIRFRAKKKGKGGSK